MFYRKGLVAASALLLAACASNEGPEKPPIKPIAPETCYTNFLDDSPSEQHAAWRSRGQGTFRYTIGPKFTKNQARIIEKVSQSADRIIPIRLIRDDSASGPATIHWKVEKLEDFSGFATLDSVIKLDPFFLGRTPLFLPGIGRHELGHVLGLSHPGKDQDGDKRHNDWNVDGPLDGQNLRSDNQVKRPDGTTPLNDIDTVMAYGRDHAEYKWMDVMTLRKLYGAGQKLPGVRHFTGNKGTCGR